MTPSESDGRPARDHPEPATRGGGAPGGTSTAAEITALVGAARAGDEDAFASIYTRFAPYVHAIALARAAPAHASDIVQETFIQAWRHLAALREPDALAGWLGAIARSRAADATRIVPTEPLDDTAASPPGLDAALDAGRVLRAIAALPEAYRETLVLRLVEGYTGPEIAALTGLTKGSVRVNLHRGLRLLRAALEVPA